MVEDVPANQLVLATMLRREGHLVDIAGSGEAALEVLDRSPYDIAFLDLHLPGINGFEAAARIRAMAGPVARVPLVGLTAAAAEETRSRCLASGMNEMIGKPVGQSALIEALAAELRPRPGRPSLAVSPVAEAAPSGLDLAGLASLRRELPAGLLAHLAEDCLTDIATRLPHWRAAMAGGSEAEAAAIAHSIAGTAATYGLARLSLLAHELSNLAAKGGADPASLGPIEAEYRAGATTLRALLEA